MTKSILRVEHLYKFFDNNKKFGTNENIIGELQKGVSPQEINEKYGVLVAVNDVSFEVAKGEIFALIGLSGSGKSTIIRCLNRLHEPSAGKIYFGEELVTAFDEKALLNFRRTKIAMVFQNFGLMTHRNVLDNICYGLEVQGIDKNTRIAKGYEMAALVGLSGWEKESVTSLSGGMKQRVGIARALANDPEILLMDEAFSALDPLVRNDLQFELLRIQEKMGKTIIFITHDINEAFKLGTKIGILRDGAMIQMAKPEEMLANPADVYVKKFINNVDSTKVLSVRTIIDTPGSLVRIQEGARTALKSMKANGVSSAYVVGEHMEFLGIITLDQALAVKDGQLEFAEAIIRDLPLINDADVAIAEIVALAANAKFPIPVVDTHGVFLGIVTKAAVLSSINA